MDRYFEDLLPLSHVFGLIRGTMSVLYTGGLWVSGADVKETLGKIPAIRPTCLVAVPGICEILMGLVKMYGKDFLGGELRFIIAGAANVPSKLINEFDAIGISLFAGYGMTEGGNLTSGNVDVKEKPTSVGKIYPGQEVKVVDGELWMRGDKLRDCLVKEEDGVIAIEILPRMEEFTGAEWEEVENYFKDVLAQVNATLPSTHRIAKLTVRKEDFKRTGTLKVSRN